MNPGSREMSPAKSMTQAELTGLKGDVKGSGGAKESAIKLIRKRKKW
jgi:hypothetical protein